MADTKVFSKQGRIECTNSRYVAEPTPAEVLAAECRGVGG